MERYFQIDDAHLSKEFQKFPSFSILDDCYPWDLSEIYDAPVLLFYKGNLDLLKFPKVAVVGRKNDIYQYLLDLLNLELPSLYEPALQNLLNQIAKVSDS
ncbi:DNA-processing protein DprA [Burkholderia contaminans]|nr:DNA-processing protein DprA [Burkholderia contaminans]